MLKFLRRISLLIHAFRKAARGFIDTFQPSGRVEAILRYAHGPKKGQVYKRLKGQNVVTSYINGAARPGGGTYNEESGRDMMRRILIDPADHSGGHGGDTDYTLYEMSLGAGSTAELASDDALETAIASSEKPFSSVEFDATNPYVTMVSVWDETEVNVAISEVGLWAKKASDPPFIARKTFNSFTKTSDFTLEIRWTIKF